MQIVLSGTSITWHSPLVHKYPQVPPARPPAVCTAAVDHVFLNYAMVALPYSLSPPHSPYFNLISFNLIVGAHYGSPVNPF